MLTCRICQGHNLHLWLSLGRQPHCNRFLTKEQLHVNEPFYPLEAYFCRDCALVQLGYTVPRETMFLDHPYVSGTTVTLRHHFVRLAREIVDRFQLSSASLVVDIGSNDGTWLKAFKGLEVRTLGVEPAVNIAELALASGIDTVTEFFGAAVAARIVEAQGKAKAVTAAGVFFHVDDLDDFMQGIQQLIADDGVFVVQAMYLLDIVEKTAFDSIYHEHLCYYSLKPLALFFQRFDMEIVDVKRIDIHGGSFVIYVRKRGISSPSVSVARLLALEEERQLYSLETFRRFAARVVNIKARLLELLRTLKAEGKRIAAYGAPARGNTLLNYCAVGTDILEYAAEKNPLKYALYTPGMHIPVIPEEDARAHPPDYFLVLAWNFLDEFLKKEQRYREQGGKFIIPIPEPRFL